MVVCSLLDQPAGPTTKIPPSLTVTASKTKGKKKKKPALKVRDERSCLSRLSAVQSSYIWRQPHIPRANCAIPKLSGIFHVGKTWAEQDQELNPTKKGTKYVNIYPTR